MEILMKRLPENIQLIILSYSINPQPSRLLEDIRGYIETKEEIEYLYEERYENLEIYPRIIPRLDKQYLKNDIIAFLNKDYYYSGRQDLHPRCIKIWKRNSYLFTPKKIKKYISQFNNPTNSHSASEYYTFLYFHPGEMVENYMRIVEQKPLQTRINLYWGMMDNRERRRLILVSRMKMEL